MVSFLNNNEVNLKVCIKCDCPLPNDSFLNYFNLDENICDDCSKIIENAN